MTKLPALSIAHNNLHKLDERAKQNQAKNRIDVLCYSIKLANYTLIQQYVKSFSDKQFYILINAKTNICLSLFAN